MKILSAAKLTSGQNSTSTTLADVTSMGFSVTSGVYYAFEFCVLYQSTATGTGIKLALTAPTTTAFSYDVYTMIAADGTAAVFDGHGTSSGDAVTATAVPAANTDYIAIIRGSILPSANGTIQLQVASETGTQITISQGTFGFLYEPNIKKTSDQQFTSTTLADVSGMALPVDSGRYYRFRFFGIYQTASTTTGITFGVTTPTFDRMSAMGQCVQNADGTAGAFQGACTSSGDGMANSVIDAGHINLDLPFFVEGIILPTASGNVQLQFASEDGGTVTVRQGTVATLEAVGEFPVVPGASRVVLY